MSWNLDWHFSICEVIAGAVGGLMYAVFRDELFLPSMVEDANRNRRVFLGLFRSILLGAFVGFIVDTHPAFSALMGFSFNDVIKAIQNKISSSLSGQGAMNNQRSQE